MRPFDEEAVRQQFAHFPEHVRERLVSSARWWSQYPENVRRAWK